MVRQHVLERTGNSIYFNNFVCNIPILGSVFSAVIKKLNAVTCFAVFYLLITAFRENLYL